MKYKLRLAEKKDEQFIKRLHKENSKEIGSFNLFYIWDNYLKRKNKYIYHIIEDVGFVRHGYSKQKKAYTIKEIAIDKNYRGKGYAEILFNQCKRPMFLTCNVDNESGNKFYEKMGMKKKKIVVSKNGLKKMNLWVK